MKALLQSRLLSGTAFLILVAGATYACADFLDSAPQGTLDDLTLANQNGVEGNLIAAYRVLDWNGAVGGAWGSAASNWVWGSVTSDDAYKGSEASDQPPITDIELYNWSTGGAEDYLNDKWRNVYEGVVRTNATIRLLNSVIADTPDEISQDDENSIRGEATFLRAHFHFEAWRMWGNIPYYREDDEDFRKSNVGVDALAEILSDLNAAIGLLPATPRNGQVGRVTSWTAEAYKGRVQMYAGDLAGARTTLGNVRASGPYALEDNYHNVWTGFQEFSNGPETILAYQSSSNDGEPEGNNANWGERLNFPHSGFPGGNCCGFHQPTQNLVNFFAVDAGGLPLALTDPNWNANDANLDATASATLMLDPRLDWTVGRDGVPYHDWGAHEPGWIRQPAFGGTYSPKKNVHENASGSEQSAGGWFPKQQNSINMHIFRYADLLLLLAEAEVEVGNLDVALEIVNEIRARAGVVAQGPGDDVSTIAVDIDDPSITWADYEIGPYTAFPDQAFARTAVRYERRLELAMEGERYFDLRRWGMAQQVLNDYVAVEANRRAFLTAAATYSERHLLFPIPTIQIELSRIGGEDRLQQNTGW